MADERMSDEPRDEHLNMLLRLLLHVVKWSKDGLTERLHLLRIDFDPSQRESLDAHAKMLRKMSEVVHWVAELLLTRARDLGPKHRTLAEQTMSLLQVLDELLAASSATDKLGGSERHQLLIKHVDRALERVRTHEMQLSSIIAVT